MKHLLSVVAAMMMYGAFASSSPLQVWAFGGGGGGGSGCGEKGECFKYLPKEEQEKAREIYLYLLSMPNHEIQLLVPMAADRICDHLDCRGIDPKFVTGLVSQTMLERQFNAQLNVARDQAFWAMIAAIIAGATAFPFGTISGWVGRGIWQWARQNRSN